MSNVDKVLQAIMDYWRENAIPPTIRAIREATGISSTSLVRSYCQKLEQRGLIKRIKSKPVPIQIYQSIKEINRNESTCRNCWKDFVLDLRGSYFLLDCQPISGSPPDNPTG